MLQHPIYPLIITLFTLFLVIIQSIQSEKVLKNRLIISSGLHGVEGYVGHAAIKAFFDSILETLNDSVEVIIYPTINPYGMDTFQRTNMDNIDLNRNFSNNNFTSKNENYLTIKSFVEPREFKNQIIMNSTFYYDLTKLIKDGVKSQLDDFKKDKSNQN